MHSPGKHTDLHAHKVDFHQEQFFLIQLYFHCSLKSVQHVRYCAAVWKICVVSPLLSLSGLQTKKTGGGVFFFEGREQGGEGHFDVTIKTHSRPVERDERERASRSKIDPGGKAKEEEMRSLSSSSSAT